MQKRDCNEPRAAPWWLRARFVAFFAFIINLAPAEAAPLIQSRDLDGDGKIEKLVLDATRDPSLTVWHGKTKIWQGIPLRYGSWKMTTGDVDGDGKSEIVLGTHKVTRFIKTPHNCCFVFGWDGRKAYKKWLGSSLSKPFTDFVLANMDADRADELVSLETLRDGKRCVVVYSWNGFGFDSDWQSGAWPQAKLLGAEKGRVFVEIDGRRMVVTKPRR